MNIPKNNKNISRPKILKLVFLFISLNIIHPFECLDTSLHITNPNIFYLYYQYKTVPSSNFYTSKHNLSHPSLEHNFQLLSSTCFFIAQSVKNHFIKEMDHNSIYNGLIITKEFMKHFYNIFCTIQNNSLHKSHIFTSYIQLYYIQQQISHHNL